VVTALLSCSVDVPVGVTPSAAAAPDEGRMIGRGKRRRVLSGGLTADPRSVQLKNETGQRQRVHEPLAVPINDRDDFAKFVRYGNAVQVGTPVDGSFAMSSLNHMGGNYTVVSSRFPSPQQKLLAAYPQATLLQMSSLKAADLIDNESLDWVYIDSKRDGGRSLWEDLTLWWKKVKPGGLFSGKNYCVTKRERLERPHLPWCGTHQNNAPGGSGVRRASKQEKASMIETVYAVTNFAARKGLPVMHTWEGRESLQDSGPTSTNPSWFFFKP